MATMTLDAYDSILKPNIIDTLQKRKPEKTAKRKDHKKQKTSEEGWLTPCEILTNV